MWIDLVSGIAGQAHHNLPLPLITTKNSGQTTKATWRLWNLSQSTQIGEESWNLNGNGLPKSFSFTFSHSFPWGLPQAQSWEGVGAVPAKTVIINFLDWKLGEEDFVGQRVWKGENYRGGAIILLMNLRKGIHGSDPIQTKQRLWIY